MIYTWRRCLRYISITVHGQITCAVLGLLLCLSQLHPAHCTGCAMQSLGFCRGNFWLICRGLIPGYMKELKSCARDAHRRLIHFQKLLSNSTWSSGSPITWQLIPKTLTCGFFGWKPLFLGSLIGQYMLRGEKRKPSVDLDLTCLTTVKFELTSL